MKPPSSKQLAKLRDRFLNLQAKEKDLILQVMYARVAVDLDHVALRVFAKEATPKATYKLAK